jgi:retron-type reverse transcriptase
MESGVKQGDPVSATLLGLVVDVILQQLDLRGYISTRLTQCSPYADGIFINTRTKQ